MNRKKVIPIVPILILAGILSYTWFIIATTNFLATIKHIIGLGLFLAATVLYAFKFKYGIIFTGTCYYRFTLF